MITSGPSPNKVRAVFQFAAPNRLSGPMITSGPSLKNFPEYYLGVSAKSRISYHQRASLLFQFAVPNSLSVSSNNTKTMRTAKGSMVLS